MKKIILIFTIIQIMSLTLFAQTSSEEVEKLRQANQETIAAYKAGKFDDALKSARIALDLTIKNFGAEHIETATSYTNLGEIYSANKKFNAAAENFQKALAIYQKNPQQNVGKIAGTTERLGIILALDGKKKEGEEFLLQSVASAENAFGKDSKEILPYLKSLSEFYIYAKKPNEAFPIFVRRYVTTAKYAESESKELQKVEDEFYCFSLQTYKSNQVSEKQAEFYKAVKDAKNKAKQSANSETTGKTISVGVVNSKAKNLATPNYPASARLRSAQGTVPVRVEIDENGRVTSANAICGDSDLQIVSVEAAKNSTFTPTTVDGKPVKVIGIIVYNFLFR